MEVLHYLTEDGADLYQDWLDRLRDLRARVTVDRRIERLVNGNFGDRKFCRDGVWELRIDVGPGVVFQLCLLIIKHRHRIHSDSRTVR